MTEWKPLHTAPKNREVLVGWQGRAFHYDFGTCFHRYYIDEPIWTFRNTVIDEGRDMPSHWCDLDPVPEIVPDDVEPAEDTPNHDVFEDMKIGWE